MNIFSLIFLSVFGLFNLLGLSQELFLRQLIYLFLGFLGYFIIKSIGSHFFRINNKFFYWFFITVLIVTFMVGLEVKGSKRWLNFYFFNFQGSEFFKVFFILFMAEILTIKNLLSNSFLNFIKVFLYFLIPFIIIFKQPDLGNAMIYFFIFFTLLIFSNFSKKYLGYLVGLIVTFTPVGWLIMKDYQKARILSFINPHLDVQGSAYNMIQSVITIGSGMFFGRGLGLGTQSRLFFLPENTTDFAFASLIEQFGFLGGFFVLIFFTIIIIYLVKKTVYFYYQKSEVDQKKFLYCLGMLTYFVSQTIINLGMNMGIMPIAGITLPFISYGGSSVMALLIGFALIP
ncbi:MAG: Rod shape-determining protein [Candidatus Roizmanbacteria bacterium GW2011_GWC2_34_23]|uniref:Rod shape-determining protein n=1 Tax=Candidatus Roizmanbacteria bacterium GW2011_GWC2_34_23 TaxID=1618484 RepID=A0A0G0AW96_9BACT|nr:MAG: Rod shape-determining protein [Candidatus Roizmanbacteria bacterium GW2011_GWC2_34_23]